jgi:uncharacterized protein GlcG (DUF336 family)
MAPRLRLARAVPVSEAAVEIHSLARGIVERAQAEARARDLKVTICVVDHAGHPVLIERMAGANLLSLEMAERKAVTAALLGTATKDLAQVVQPGQPLYGLTHVGGGKFVAFGGGYPLRRPNDNGLIGAVGVSGGSIEEDTAIVEAALIEKR